MPNARVTIATTSVAPFVPPVAGVTFYRGRSYASIVIYSDGSRNGAVAFATAAAGRL